MVAEKAQIGEREGEEMTNEKMSQKKERLSGSQGQGLCEFLLVLKLRPCRSPPPPYLPDCFCRVPLPVNGAPQMPLKWLLYKGHFWGVPLWLAPLRFLFGSRPLPLSHSSRSLFDPESLIFSIFPRPPHAPPSFILPPDRS